MGTMNGDSSPRSAEPATSAAPTAVPQDSDAEGVLRRLVAGMGFEVMPFKSTEETVAKFVPLDVPLTVTTTAAKGLGATLDLAVRLRARGYTVAPHLAARQVTGPDEVDASLGRLEAADITRAFVIGGDAPEPAGPYLDALGLLRAFDERGHSLTNLGIGGYPEGHGFIPTTDMDQAIRDKAPLATQVLTQICFDAATTVSWDEALVSGGVTLPGQPAEAHPHQRRYRAGPVGPIPSEAGRDLALLPARCLRPVQARTSLGQGSRAYADDFRGTAHLHLQRDRRCRGVASSIALRRRARLSSTLERSHCGDDCCSPTRRRRGATSGAR